MKGLHRALCNCDTWRGSAKLLCSGDSGGESAAQICSGMVLSKPDTVCYIAAVGHYEVRQMPALVLECPTERLLVAS